MRPFPAYPTWPEACSQIPVPAELGAHIPVELQNGSLVVYGTIRVLHGEVHDVHDSHVRVIQADVMQ